MTTTTPVSDQFRRPPLFGIRTLHLFALCSFAITQPLLTALAGRTVYLHDQQFDWLEIGVMLAVVTIAVPLTFVLADRIVLLLASRWHGRGRNFVVGILFFMVAMTMLRPYVAVAWLKIDGSAGFLAMSIAIPTTIGLIYLYDRYGWFRSWVTFSAVGLLLFPLAFAWQFHNIRRAELSMEGAVSVSKPVPIVFVVFDEFSSTTLLNEHHEIDEEKFPNFARLAQRTTWYRNATTVHPRTDIAVPAILSGRYPVTDLRPIPAEYPGNLFQLVEATKIYEMAVFEPVTRICPTSIRVVPHHPRTQSQKCGDLIYTLATVYPRLIFPSDTPTWFPVIPKPWFGMAPFEMFDDKKLTHGLFNYSGTENRNQQLSHFLRCLLPSEQPRFCFLHTVLPHYPWCFLPSGALYQAESTAAHFPSGASGELGEDWREDDAIVLRNEYRYRLQLGYTDRFIGQLLDRLEDTGLMDKCLLVVTGDHGVSFRSGHSRRLVDTDNLPDILSVPLFVKLPGQADAAVDDRNVETIDILPTLAEVIGMELPEPVDGISVSQPVRRLRKTLYFDGNTTIVEPDVPQRAAALKRQLDLFGNGKLDQPLTAWASHPDWLGQPVDRLTINPQPIGFRLLDPLKSHAEDEDFSQVRLQRNFVSGHLETTLLPSIPADLVIAVDGIVRDTGHSYPFEGNLQAFEFLLPESLMDDAQHSVDLYVVEPHTTGPRLRLLKDDPEQHPR